VALTGAGISVESGIPDFRSACGLWAKYDPSVYANIESFRTNPKLVWEIIFDMMDTVFGARPNPAHRALARLEKMGYLKSIITQNIDNLHQMAGSTKVIEYHGNVSRLECLECGEHYSRDEFTISEKKIPQCRKCREILKPSVVFFGELIPHLAMTNSNREVMNADAVIVVGTSAIVYPVAAIPLAAKRNGALIIEFNIEKTDLTTSVTDVYIEGPAGSTLEQFVEQLSVRS
jgi:NAD-dependent deacetylase